MPTNRDLTDNLSDEDRNYLDGMAVGFTFIFLLAPIALISYWVTHACDYGC